MIQQALVEYGWSIGFRPLRSAPPRDGHVAVIGSGPAGLSCAAELAKRGYSVTVFEERERPGGVLRYGVPQNRFDERLLEEELEDIRALGVVLRCSEPIRGRDGVQRLLESGFDSVFIAHGLWEAVPVLESRERLEGLYNSIDFLSSLRGTALSKTTDRFRGKRVAVVGGGDVAMDCALSAIRLGARDVYLVYRRAWAQMPASEEERIEALRAGIQFLLLNQPIGYQQGTRGELKGVHLVRTRLGEDDRDGRKRPDVVTGSEWTLEADIVIEAVGNRADRHSRDWYPSVRMEDRLICINPGTGATNVPGMFAGGDVVRGSSLVVEAVQDGKVAAAGIAQYLEGKLGRLGAEGRSSPGSIPVDCAKGG